MFDKVKKWVKSMFGSKTIEEALDVELAINETMINAQHLWRAMVQGKASWNDEENPSLQIASGICTEVARSVTVEFESDVNGSPRAEYINEQYQRFIDNSRLTIEKLCGGGEIVLKPYVKGKNILVTVVENNMYFPVEYNEQDKLTRVVFAERVFKDDLYYVLFEDHDWNENLQTYEIRYKAFVSEDGYVLKEEIAPSSFENWAEIKDMKFSNIKQPLFVSIKMPQQNTIDLEAPQGVAIFSKAVDLIKEADKQFGRTVWEFEGGELAINASIDLFRKDKGTNELVLPNGKKRLYKTYDVETDRFALETFNPQYRDESLFNGLDKILKKIEFVCQLSYGTISDVDSMEKTATEIRKSKQRFYSLVVDIQKVYKTGLEELINSMDILATLYKLSPIGVFESTFSFDDSIIVDREKELEERVTLLGAGILNDFEVRAWYLGMSEEEAKKTMPKMETLLKDEEEEDDNEKNKEEKEMEEKSDTKGE